MDLHLGMKKLFVFQVLIIYQTVWFGLPLMGCRAVQILYTPFSTGLVLIINRIFLFSVDELCESELVRFAWILL